jgi:hypothetical protein
MSPLPSATSASTPLADMSCANCGKPMTLADCLPWLEIALDYIDHGPSGLTIQAVERHRRSLMEILEHIREAVEREAKLAPVH